MPKKREDYERLGRMLEEIYEVGAPSRRRMYRTSFLKGILGGLGGVLGATLLVGLLLWLLQVFHRIPLVGPFVQSLRNTINQDEQ